MDHQEIIKNIKSRLSLRQPLRDSLDIVAHLADLLALEEISEPAELKAALEKVQAHYPTCSDFERDFISVAFSIATGVGKTRLMGAIMAYLYLTGRSRNFFVLAPNLTIYEKLIEDFGNPGFSKYVFKGIEEFVANPPVIITGDNYAQSTGLFSGTEMRINVFNISKFNKDTTEERSKDSKSKPPRIKRISEYLGQSYWDFLIKLDDLVILMDEAHRYHADKSKQAIAELRPVLGIELTATPLLDDKGSRFKNIVFEYSLAQALHDGKYIKIPSIATRANFDPKGKTPDELERIKLEDAISVHENTKVELERYALESGRPKVKPFVLVVCSDTTHAKQVFDYVRSDAFYEGAYSNKALQIDSTTKTEEIEKQFVTLEKPENKIEIVIHVNMLKEGWDVTNLYTIVPLRAAKALTLIEQTIGRGLRLPYGERTNDKHADTLTVIAHDHFDAVISAAKDPNSLLNKMQLVEIQETELGEKRIVVRTEDRVSERLKAEQKRIDTMQDAAEKQRGQHSLDAKRAIINALPLAALKVPVRGVQDLEKSEVKAAVIQTITEELAKAPKTLFSVEEHLQIVQEAEHQYLTMVQEFKQNIIEIPRFTLQPAPPEAVFNDFDLNTDGTTPESNFDLNKLDATILRQTLTTHEQDYIGVLHGAKTTRPETPEQRIVSDLLLFPQVNYDQTKDLLFKLAKQALDAIKAGLRMDETIDIVVQHHRKTIAQRIYTQMNKRFEIRHTGFVTTGKVQPFTRIEPWNVTIPISAGRLHWNTSTFNTGEVKKHIFMGFSKACHLEYTFDSLPELEFARVLEHDPAVAKWLRPAPTQFQIYWDRQSKKYEPDFVVETADKIYLVEIKASNEMTNPDVLQKAEAATIYCRQATEYAKQTGKKAWKYLLVPHDAVRGNVTFGYLEGAYGTRK
ncbi:MAG: DEAD/DEAH box helicase family protein [Bacteroidota bacterium]